MKKRTSHQFSLAIVLLFTLFFGIVSCKKTTEEESLLEKQTSSELTGRDSERICNLLTTTCEDCSFQEQDQEDEVSNPTILGGTFNNPYSISVMTQAYNNIYNPDISSLAATHYYVKFKPNDISQLNILDSLDIELYDYPLNRHVLQDGDYWPEAYYGIPATETPWLYSVVEANFQFPSGIQYQILESLFIPNDAAILEDEAFYLTANLECDSVQYKNVDRLARIEQYRLIPYDPCDFPNPPEWCVGGTGGDPGGGGVNIRKPNGQINFKTYSLNPGARLGASGPLKYVRVVGKRFFKIDKTYTDDNGNFQFSKSFPRKVTLVVKFKTSQSHGQYSVRIQQGQGAVWSAMFPLRKNIGTYKGNNLQNLNYEFQKGSTSTKRKTKQWVAAVSFNTTEESRSFLNENNMTQLPNDIRVYLHNTVSQTNLPYFDLTRRSSAPLFNQNRWLLNDIFQYGGTSLIGSAALAVVFFGGPLLAAPLVFIAFSAAPQHPDVYIHYRSSDINSLSASNISVVTGTQLGLTYLNKIEKQSSATGKGYQDYTFSIQYVRYRYTYDDYSPFGNGLDNNSSYHQGLVAIWQGVSQHFGHTISDRLYGIGTGDFALQGKQWISDLNSSSSKKFLEEFNPSISAPNDYFSWIPVGLINDLMDNTIEPTLISEVDDNVSGFTYQEIQSALTNKPSEMVQFRDLLKSIKPSQSTQIDQLFTSYGY